MQPLHEANRLGPTFLQLGPQFSGQYWELLENFLRILPQEMQWAVEFRHQDWFHNGTYQQAAESLLRELRIDRVIFDASYIHRINPRTEAEKISQTRKPNSPLIESVTAMRPMARLIGSDLITADDTPRILTHWSQWVDRIVAWLKQGLQPYVFIHTPNDAYAPALTRAFYTELQTACSQAGLPDLPPLPSLPTGGHAKSPAARQTLFDFDP